MILNHQQIHLKTVRTSLAVITAPAQYIIEWPAKMLEWLGESFISNQKLLSENEKLRTQLLLINAQLQQMILLEHENNQLRKFLHSSVRVTDKVLIAQLLAVDPDPFAQQVIINKGEDHKLYLGQPVLDENGVFGQVVQLGAFSSRVMLITDTRSAVPVQDNRSGVRGIVIGKGDSTRLALVDMPTTADIRIGDHLVTSGLGEVFPVGYPVGVITDITQTSENQFFQVTIVPAAHLNEGHLVLLIWPAFLKTLEAQKKAELLAKTTQKAEPNANAA